MSERAIDAENGLSSSPLTALMEGYVGNLTDDQQKGLKELWEKVSEMMRNSLDEAIDVMISHNLACPSLVL